MLHVGAGVRSLYMSHVVTSWTLAMRWQQVPMSWRILNGFSMAAILEDGIGWRRTSWKSLKSFTRMGSWMASPRPILVLYPKKKTQKRFLTSYWSALVQAYTKLLLVLVHPIISALHNTIEEHQMAFIEGRQILDLALIANEVVKNTELSAKNEWTSKSISQKPTTMWIGISLISSWKKKASIEDGEHGSVVASHQSIF